jgi:nitrogen fixation protein FixH
MVTNDSGGRRVVTGRMVLICLVAFFTVVGVVNAIMMTAAVSTFAGLESESAYRSGLAFEQEIAAAEKQEALHWQVEARLERADGGARRIEIAARDADGGALAGLNAAVTLVHPTDRRLDRSVAMTAGSQGRFNGTTGPAVGQWDVVIELSRDGARAFRSRNRVVLD